MAGNKQIKLFGWAEPGTDPTLRSYCDTIARLMEKFDLDEPEVLAEYELGDAIFPVVSLQVKSSQLILRYEPGGWPSTFIVSVDSPTAIPSLFGLFDPTLDLSDQSIAGMKKDWLFGSYRKNQSRFSCEIEDEWDLAMLVRILRSVGLLDWAAIPRTSEGTGG